MLAKNIFTIITLAVLAAFTVNAQMPKKRDDDPDRNPTNYVFFDPNGDVYAPSAACDVAAANIRRCGEDRHSLWTCTLSEDGKSAAWAVDQKTDETGNNCAQKCCRPNEIAESRTNKCTRGYKYFERQKYCWQLLKQDMLA